MTKILSPASRLWDQLPLCPSSSERVVLSRTTWMTALPFGPHLQPWPQPQTLPSPVLVPLLNCSARRDTAIHTAGTSPETEGQGQSTINAQGGHRECSCPGSVHRPNGTSNTYCRDTVCRRFPCQSLVLGYWVINRYKTPPYSFNHTRCLQILR